MNDCRRARSLFGLAALTTALACGLAGCSAEAPGVGHASNRKTAGGAHLLDALDGNPLPVTVTRAAGAQAVDAERSRILLRLPSGELLLDLERNDALVSADYKTYEVDAAGKLSERDVKDRAPFCHYTGKLLEPDGSTSGSVWLSSCDADGHDAFIALIVAQNGLIELRQTPASAGNYELARVTRPAFIDEDVSPPRIAAEPGSVLSPQALNPTGPGGQAWIENVIVNDARRLTGLGSVNATELGSLALTNMQAGLYYGSTLAPPVRLGVVAQVTFSADPYTPNLIGSEVDTSDLLNKFANWGATAALPKHDHRQLLSGFDFNGSTVGLSYLGAMCSPSTSASVVQVLASTPVSAVIAAHELGHSLSMQHDETAGCGGGFIMSASVCGNCPSQPSNFSSCSQAAYASFLTPSLTCLANPITTTYHGPTCGNAIVESGEQCDCGSSNCQGKDACCNGSTCQLTATATCSANDSCCDPQQCRPRAAGTLCRAAASACDLPERCTGGSALCPTDVYVRAGNSCADPLSSSAVCYQGYCRSREQQCSAIAPQFSLGALTPCDTLSCGALTCRQLSTGSCFSFSGNKYVDGTPCGAGSQCLNDACVSSASLTPVTAVPAPALPRTGRFVLPLLLLGLGLCVLPRRARRGV